MIEQQIIAILRYTTTDNYNKILTQHAKFIIIIRRILKVNMTDLKTLNIQIDFIKGKMIMNVIFFRSEFTMTELDAAIEFHDECSKLLSSVC